jgi:hypothetical protein
MPRLRPLSEAECYTRLYGDWESTVSVIAPEPSRPVPVGPSGEALRLLFEERLDAREADVTEPEAA